MVMRVLAAGAMHVVRARHVWRMRMAAAGIGAALRLERLVDLQHGQVHGAQHVGQHMVGLDLEVVGLEFDRHMAVAQVVGGADQVKRDAMAAAGRDAQHRLRCCTTLISEPSSATSTSPPRTTVPRGKKTPSLPPGRVGGFKAAFLPHVPVQLDMWRALEQHRGQALALGNEFGDLQHQNKK